MKRISNYIGCLFILILALCACKDEVYVHPSEAGIPLASDIEVAIEVDQTTNEVTFSINNKRCMPVWIFNGKTYSTVNGLSKIYPKAGTYSVEVKLANANGVSDGSVVKEFTINNTIVDASVYIKQLAGDDKKEWVIAKKEEGHLGCGESGSDGLGWYSASPNEKAAMGVYDDIMTFGVDKTFVYDPGVGGTVYVNKDCSIFSEFNPQDGDDFMATVDLQNATYDFDIDGDDLYITFPSKTLFPYIPNDDIYNTPRYRIVSIKPSRLELVADNGSIAWHYILVSGEESKPGGYNPDNACNLWKNATYTNEFFYAPGWTQIDNPVIEANGNSYKIILPQATTDTWQAQVKFLTDMATNAANNYDFSAILNTTKDHNNVTVKLVKTGEDDVYYFLQTVKLKAYEDYTLIKTDMAGIDMDKVSLVFDFGGNAENTEVTVSRIVLKEHSCDDGTIIAPPVEEEDVIWLPDAASNLWNGSTYTNTFFYAPGWAQIADPTIEVNGNSYTIALPTATTDQWQAQVQFHTDMATSSDNAYDFRCIFNATKDMKGVTVKLAKEGDDDTFFFTERVDLVAFEEYIFKQINMEGIDMEKVNLVFDFGGNPENTEVTVSSIILQKHGAGAVNWDANSDCNTWKVATYNNTFFYAPGWAQIDNPVIEVNGNSYKFALPTATTDQWQAQVHFHSTLNSNAANSYDFQCILTANQNLSGVTVKLAKEGDDDTFYFTERIDLSAFEEYAFRMSALPGLDMESINLVFDFGGNPENTEITISDIIFKESGCNN